LPVKTMSARFDEKLYEEILGYAREKGVPKTRALRELTEEGVKKWMLTRALALYREGKVTVWKASRMAGVPLSRMIEVASSEKIPIHYGREDLERDLSAFGETF
jgi:predicted HTH domain antitoxin